MFSNHRKFATLVWAACSIFAAGAASAVEPDWRIFKPSNTGIPGDYTNTIYVDENDLPWIAGYTPFWEEGGMGHFDGQRWRVLSNVDCPEILSPRFNDIERDAAGVFWIGSDYGLLRFDPAIEPWCVTRFDPGNSPLTAGIVSAVDIAPDGSIWVANWDPNNWQQGGLGRYVPSTGTWQFWSGFNGLPWSGEAFPVSWIEWLGLTPDSDGGYTVWFGNAPMGSGKLKMPQGQFTWFGNTPDPPDGSTVPWFLWSHDSTDSDGNLWVQTNDGLARRSPNGTFTVIGRPANVNPQGITRVFALSGGRAILETDQFEGGVVYQFNGSQWVSLGSPGNFGRVYAFAEESDGDIWVGGTGGAAKRSGNTWQRYRVTNTGMIGYFMQTLALGADGRVYMNGNAAPGVGGFDIYNSATDTWTNINHLNYGLGPAWGQPTDNVESLWGEPNGDVLISETGAYGIKRWNGSTYTSLIPEGYSNEEVLADGLGRVWSNRYLGYGFDMLDGENWYTFDNGNSPLLAGVDSIKRDPLGAQWVWCISADQLIHTNGAEWEVFDISLFDEPGLGGGVFVVEPHPDGTVWIGIISRGLFHFDPQSGATQRYHTGNSILPSNDVKLIEAAPDGSIWLATFDQIFPYPGGLTHIDGENWTHYQQGSSPLEHNQLTDIESRPTVGGYEVWVATASEGIARITVRTALLGDMNCDGFVTVGDISGFVLALTDPAGYAAQFPGCNIQNADVNGDGFVSVGDIGAFVTLLVAN